MKRLIPALTLLAIHALSGVWAQSETPACGRRVRLSDFVSDCVQSRNVDIWLPPGYDHQNTYPVLYMQDGQNLFDPEEAFGNTEWGLDEALCQLITAGRIPPIIVVGVWNTPQRRSEYYPTDVYERLPECKRLLVQPDGAEAFARGNEYLSFLTSELIPWMQHYFRTTSVPALTFIGGSSMGGLISAYALCRYPEHFGGVICLSTHWVGNFVTTHDEVISDVFAGYIAQHLPEPGLHRVYMDYGSATIDAYYAKAQDKIDEAMRDKGYGSFDWTTRFFEGAAHHENDWRERIHIPLEWMFSPLWDQLSILQSEDGVKVVND